MTQRFFRLWIVLVIGVVLVACAAPAAAPSAEQPTGAARAGEKQVLDLWFNSDDLFNQYNEKIIASFEAANPDIDIVYSPYPNEAYKTTLQVAIGSDDPPDIFFNWAGDDTGRYVREGHLLDLTAYAAQYNWGDQLSPAMLAAFSVADEVYGVPYSQEAKYFYYHIDLFDEMGLTVPTTFDELLALCTKVSDAGMPALAFGNQERWEGVHYMSIFNQKVVGEDTLAADYSLSNDADTLFADPNYAEAFRRLQAMQAAGCFGNAINSTTPDAALIQFVNKQTPMYYQGTWIMGSLKDNGLEGQYGMFRMPPMTDDTVKGNQNYVLAGPVGLEISIKTPYPDAAAKFLDFYISKESQMALLVDTNHIPVRADAVDRAKAASSVVAVVDDLAAAEGTAFWLDVVLENSISEVYLNSIQEVLAGTKTPEEAMQAVREQALKVKAEIDQ
ncbi:MAG: extracellular solute-binding protein [Caldilineaceae bacterium]|nr:extracellular solute-binding protein [Caldilineaceae bacterium]